MKVHFWLESDSAKLNKNLMARQCLKNMGKKFHRLQKINEPFVLQFFGKP